MGWSVVVMFWEADESFCQQSMLLCLSCDVHYGFLGFNLPLNLTKELLRAHGPMVICSGHRHSGLCLSGDSYLYKSMKGSANFIEVPSVSGGGPPPMVKNSW